MQNYIKTPVSGQRWTRCAEVVICNPEKGLPSVCFREEDIMVIESETISKTCGTLHKQFDASNPDHVEVHRLLRKIYFELAQDRINQISEGE